jgi:hypothetical protein
VVWWFGWGLGWVVSEGYEAYEIKKKRGKLRCLILRRKKIFLNFYDVITSPEKKNALSFTTERERLSFVRVLARCASRVSACFAR